MKLLLTAILLFITQYSFGGDLSMLGIKINDPKSKLSKIKLEIVAQEKDIIKFRTLDKNDFSVTTKNGVVVFIENDFLHDVKGQKPLLTNFIFGKTSLKDIRNRFGTNGFTYTESSFMTTETDLITFNCFEINSANNEILVMVTKVSLKEKPTEQNIAEHMKLDAIILANKSYLDEIWGTDKKYDSNYKKIQL